MKKSIERIRDEIVCLYIRLFGPSLRKIVTQHQGRRLIKWDHYLEIYDRHFSKFRGKTVTVVEIGVYQGGGLQVWRKYFGPKAVIYGIDIDPRCALFAEKSINIILNDQASREFWKTFKTNVPKVDILIDDGGHFMHQQIVTFEEMFPHIENGGVYICEDLHTSYWADYDGGLLRKGTFIEFAKGLIDRMHAWHSRTDDFQVDSLTRSIPAMEFYDSVLVIGKEKVFEPIPVKFGTPVFPESQ